MEILSFTFFISSTILYSISLSETIRVFYVDGELEEDGMDSTDLGGYFFVEFLSLLTGVTGLFS